MQESSTEHPFDRSAAWTLAAALRNSSCVKATLAVFFYIVSTEEVHKIFLGDSTAPLPQHGHNGSKTLLRVIEHESNLEILLKTRHVNIDHRLHLQASRR
jgi:hypothetical protein